MFKLAENNTNIKTEIIAGITTFLTMVYIVVVNPIILSDAGVPFDQVLNARLLQQSLAYFGWHCRNHPIAIAGYGLKCTFRSLQSLVQMKAYPILQQFPLICSKYYFVILWWTPSAKD